jgi:hypothetical protein
MRPVAAAGVVAALVLAASAGGSPTWSSPIRLSPADRAIGPELALAENGRAVVVWDREVGPDCATAPASLSCVHIVDAVAREPGAAWGPPVELGRPGVGSLPRVAVNPAGDAVVSWIHDIGADRVLQATYRHGPAGTWPEPNDLSAVAERIREHHVALDGGGDAVAAWAELGGGGFFRVEVEVRSAASGVWGAPIRLSTAGSAVLAGPSLAVDEAGRALVAWDEDGTIRVARGSAASGSWEQPVTISTPGTAPSAALDADGAAIVVWTSGASVEAAFGTPAGDWEAPLEVSSTPGAPPSDPKVALGSSGTAVAVWLVAHSVYAAARGAGRWSKPTRISPALAADPAIAVARSGNAVAVWSLTGGAVQAARRAAVSGAWEPPVDVSASGASGAAVAIDAAIDPVVVWNRDTPGAVLAEAADLVGAGPVLGPAHVPARANVGARAVFSIEPAPWAAALAGPPVWRFGDGTSARGRRVTHVYRRRGRYTVSVGQRDAAGGSATTSATIRVRR